MKKNIFISAPIAGYEKEEDYFVYREIMENICLFLQERYGVANVYSALLNIANFDSYDSPEKSAIVDLQYLERMQYFILFYPIKVATSALTELGVALGMNKKILIVTPNIQILPYMVQGLSALSNRSVNYIEKDILKEDIVDGIINFIDNE